MSRAMFVPFLVIYCILKRNSWWVKVQQNTHAHKLVTYYCFHLDRIFSFNIYWSQAWHLTHTPLSWLLWRVYRHLGTLKSRSEPGLQRTRPCDTTHTHEKSLDLFFFKEETFWSSAVRFSCEIKTNMWEAQFYRKLSIYCHTILTVTQCLFLLSPQVMWHLDPMTEKVYNTDSWISTMKGFLRTMSWFHVKTKQNQFDSNQY